MVLFFIMLSAYVLSTVGGLILLKLGSTNGPPVSFKGKSFQFNLTRLTTTGVILYAVSFFFYTYLISKYDLGFIIPLATALVYITLFICSRLVFEEVFTKRKILAVTLIITGIITLGIHGA